MDDAGRCLIARTLTFLVLLAQLWLVGVCQAEDRRASILADDDSSTIIKPRHQRANTSRPPQAPEGIHVIDRIARFDRLENTNWYTVSFEDQPDLPKLEPMLVLPNDLLEHIEPLLRSQPGILLKICGENSLYRGKQFIWLTESSRVDSEDKSVDAGGDADDYSAKDQEPEDEPKASPAGSEDLVSRSETEAGAILENMAAQRPGRRILMPDEQDKQRPIGRGRVNPTRQTIKPKHSMVIDRVVRILPEQKEGWWSAYFEGDNTLQEPPIRILPGRMLERAEALVTGSRGVAVRFRVSGMVTEYNGKQYLVLCKLLQEHDLGQF